MDAIQLQAMEKETNRRREAELKRINSALKRIHSKDYGYCMACDEPIANERLENDLEHHPVIIVPRSPDN